MTQMKKRALALLCSVGMLLTILAGCGSGTAPDGANSSATSGEAGKEQGKVEITFWHTYTDTDAGPINKVVESFNKSQDRISVKMLGNQDSTKQLTAISGGAAPDILLTFWNNIGPWAEAGAIMELSDNIQKDGFDVNALIQAAAERMSIHGKYYGMPFTMSMANSLLYNKKAFEEAGITAPPETLEQMFEIAKQLTKRDGSGNIKQIGFIPDYPWIDNVFWPIIFGGSWYDESTGKVTPNDPANVAAIAYQRSFYDEFGADQIARFKSGMGKRGTPQDPMLTGQLAMYIGWEYNFRDERAEDGPIGVAPFPYPAAKPELKGAGMVSPRAIFIPAKAKHPAEAWEFMKYLMTQDAQIEFSLEAKVIPTIKAALDDERLRTDANKTMLPFLEAAKSENLEGFPNSSYINEYLQALSEETEKALKGTQTPQEAMDKVAQKIQLIADKAAKKQ
ncbi:ABC transporter substrate-binding protein [Paenibacillus thiaminolyticus]|uniref:ABC transporter substrate-binding protein n=1 Tax=Paenibacillus thiaminolyticus TaxID=49283 RepID=UPI00232C7660|nr:ABC transporter substrate-binding protein [Paenibacillus thiaminolyticus]WCF09295.1 ABC transporter substrate-binding protein [Paenibacillus thiaminolyticus]